MSWLAAELPPGVPVACVERAAVQYAIPPAALAAILRQEGGVPGRVYTKKTGRYYGAAQISGKWIQTLSQWGFTPAALQYNACANVVAGAYVLAYYQVREHDWFRAIARYNVGSLNTPAQREAGERYATAVMGHWWGFYKKWTVPA